MGDAREQHIRQFDTGQYLLSIRNERKESLATASKVLNISAVYLSEIERGLKLPSDSLIRQIAEYYEIDEDDLFFRFGKVPLIAREALEQCEGLQKMLATIHNKKRFSEDKKQKLYDKLTKLYKEFLESEDND